MHSIHLSDPLSAPGHLSRSRPGHPRAISAKVSYPACDRCRGAGEIPSAKPWCHRATLRPWHSLGGAGGPGGPPGFLPRGPGAPAPGAGGARAALLRFPSPVGRHRRLGRIPIKNIYHNMEHLVDKAASGPVIFCGSILKSNQKIQSANGVQSREIGFHFCWAMSAGDP